MNIRKAMAITFLERYFNVAAQFGLTAIVARLMTPEEFGLVAIGVSILAIMETIRDFGISNYIVQHQNLTRDVARTGFAVIVIISCALAALLFLASSAIATFYGDARLIPYLEVMALIALIGIAISPLRALLLREMEFQKIAFVNFGATLVFTATIIILALLGFSYISYAWGGLAMTMTTAILFLYFKRDYWIFRPAFHDLKQALAFGSYSSLSDTLSRLQDSLPFLILGHFMPFSAVGIFNRSHFLSTVPAKLLMVGVMPVALPGFAAEVRTGRNLKEPLLSSLSFLAVFLWPALILLAFVAHPTVLIILGEQWVEAIPIVQILSIAGLASVPLPLAFPVLSALGKVRISALAGLFIVPVTAITLVGAAQFGLLAIAISFLFLTPFQAFLVLWMFKQYIAFQWKEVFSATAKSAVVAAISSIPSFAIIAFNGFSFFLSIPAGITTGLLMIPAWLAGVWLTSHPVANEIRIAAGAISGRLAAKQI